VRLVVAGVACQQPAGADGYLKHTRTADVRERLLSQCFQTGSSLTARS
jgi:hypothetical protein